MVKWIRKLLIVRCHLGVKSVSNTTFLLHQPSDIPSAHPRMTSHRTIFSPRLRSNILCTSDISVQNSSLTTPRECSMKKNTLLAPIDLVPLCIELLESALEGIVDARMSYLIDSVTTCITDEHLKHYLFRTAITNLSKVSHQEDVDRFSSLVSKYSILTTGVSNFLDSDDIRWSDNYIAALHSSRCSSPVRSGESLSSNLEQIAKTTAATAEWFTSVNSAREQLSRLLRVRMRLDSIELFGSTRSGLSGMTSDADMTCLMKTESVHSDDQIDLSEYDREYIRQRTEIDRLNRKIAATDQFSVILRSISGRVIDSAQIKSNSYSNSLSTIQVSVETELEKYRSEVRQLEISLRLVQIDRHKQSLIHMIRNKNLPSAAAMKKVVYRIGDILRKNGYSHVQVIPFARVPVVKCRDRVGALDIDLVIDKRIATYNSDLIKDYMRADESGKVKKVALLLKALVKAHNMGDARAGSLSSYSWVVLLLHTFLRHGFLPAFRPAEASNSDEPSVGNFCESFYVGFSVPHPLPPYYRDRLASTSVAELLIIFTGYLTTRVNVARDCLTMRGQGEIFRKGIWNSDDVTGRSQPGSLSIEDPFERADSICGHDLGRSINTQKNCDIIIGKLVAINGRLRQAILSPRESNDKKDTGGGSLPYDIYGIFDEKSITSEAHRFLRQVQQPSNLYRLQTSDEYKIAVSANDKGLGGNETGDSEEADKEVKEKSKKPRKRFARGKKSANANVTVAHIMPVSQLGIGSIAIMGIGQESSVLAATFGGDRREDKAGPSVSKAPMRDGKLDAGITARVVMGVAGAVDRGGVVVAVNGGGEIEGGIGRVGSSKTRWKRGGKGRP